MTRNVLYRQMETYCYDQPGTFCFSRPVYADGSSVPPLAGVRRIESRSDALGRWQFGGACGTARLHNRIELSVHASYSFAYELIDMHGAGNPLCCKRVAQPTSASGFSVSVSVTFPAPNWLDASFGRVSLSFLIDLPHTTAPSNWLEDNLHTLRVHTGDTKPSRDHIPNRNAVSVRRHQHQLPCLECFGRACRGWLRQMLRTLRERYAGGS